MSSFQESTKGYTSSTMESVEVIIDEQHYSHSTTANIILEDSEDEEDQLLEMPVVYGALLATQEREEVIRRTMEMEDELEERALDNEWRSYQLDWSYLPCSNSLKEDFRYSATSPLVNTLCAIKDFKGENQYVAKFEDDEETDSISTHLNDKTEEIEGELSEEIKEHQFIGESFQDIEIEFPIDKFFENPNPRYTCHSQTYFDDFFDNQMILEFNSMPCFYDHAYRLDFHEKETFRFNFDNCMPKEPELEKKIYFMLLTHTLFNHTLFCFYKSIMVMVAYIHHKFCKS